MNSNSNKEECKHEFKEYRNPDIDSYWMCIHCKLVQRTPDLDVSKGWEEDFREYFDKTLKPKKPTMGNLDRELCIDFIGKQISKAVNLRMTGIMLMIDELIIDDTSKPDEIYAHGQNVGNNMALEELQRKLKAKYNQASNPK